MQNTWYIGFLNLFLYRVIQGKSPPPLQQNWEKLYKIWKHIWKIEMNWSWLQKKPKPNNQISEFCCNSKYATRSLQMAFFESQFWNFFSTENLKSPLRMLSTGWKSLYLSYIMLSRNKQLRFFIFWVRAILCGLKGSKGVLFGQNWDAKNAVGKLRVVYLELQQNHEIWFLSLGFFCNQLHFISSFQICFQISYSFSQFCCRGGGGLLPWITLYIPYINRRGSWLAVIFTFFC